MTSPRPSPVLPEWLSGEPQRWRLRVAVQPGASRTEVVGIHDGCLKLRVAAPPIDGRANDELVRWLARQLSVPRSQLRIAGGESSRRKSIAIEASLAAADLLRALAPGN